MEEQNVTSDLFDAIAWYAQLGSATKVLYEVHQEVGKRVVDWDEWGVVVKVIRQLEDELLARFDIVD